MTYNLKYETVCGDESDDILHLSFDQRNKNVTLEHTHGKDVVEYYGWTSEKQIMTFSLECFEEILSFVKYYGNRDACDYTTVCQDKTILNIHIEGDFKHLFIDRDGESIAICQDHIYRMYLKMHILMEMLTIIKELF